MPRRTEMLFLLIGICHAPVAHLDRAAIAEARPIPMGAGVVAVRSTSLAAPSPHARLSRAPSWRQRIKSVLEETDLSGFRPADLGPASTPDHLVLTRGDASITAWSRPSAHLRC